MPKVRIPVPRRIRPHRIIPPIIQQYAPLRPGALPDQFPLVRAPQKSLQELIAVLRRVQRRVRPDPQVGCDGVAAGEVGDARGIVLGDTRARHGRVLGGIQELTPGGEASVPDGVVGVEAAGAVVETGEERHGGSEREMEGRLWGWMGMRLCGLAFVMRLMTRSAAR